MKKLTLLNLIFILHSSFCLGYTITNINIGVDSNSNAWTKVNNNNNNFVLWLNTVATNNFLRATNVYFTNTTTILITGDSQLAIGTNALSGAALPAGIVINNTNATIAVTNGAYSTSLGTNSVAINGGSLFLKSTNGSTYFSGGQYYHQLFTTNEDMYILPQGNNAGRLYFGNPSTPQMFYSLNFAGVTVFESLPPLIGPSLADNFCGLYNLNTGTPNLTAYYSVIIAGGFFANPPALNYASTASLIVTNPTATEVVEQIIGNNIQTGDLLDFWVNGAKEANVSSNGQFTVPTLLVTNLTLTTTSAAPVSTTPVVWFAFTNAGKLYKVGGCQ